MIGHPVQMLGSFIVTQSQAVPQPSFIQNDQTSYIEVISIVTVTPFLMQKLHEVSKDIVKQC